MAVVCHCAVVTDRDVVACIGEGATTLAQVCRSTRAGQSCGGCVQTVRDLLCQHCPVAALRARPWQVVEPIEEMSGAAV
jgi:bacterioferritin-associated ferredoxin